MTRVIEKTTPLLLALAMTTLAMAAGCQKSLDEKSMIESCTALNQAINPNRGNCDKMAADLEAYAQKYGWLLEASKKDKARAKQLRELPAVKAKCTNAFDVGALFGCAGKNPKVGAAFKKLQ